MITIVEACDKSIEKFNDRRRNTARTYRQGLRQFQEYLTHTTIDPHSPTDTLTADLFIHFTDYLNGLGLKRRSLQVYLASVINLVNWLEEEGLFDPGLRDSRRIERRYRDFMRADGDHYPEIPEKTEGEKILEAAEERLEAVERTNYKNEDQKKHDLLICRRNLAVCHALASSGLRNSELRALTVGQVKINGERGEAWITGKGGKQRLVFFDARAVDALAGYWRVRGWNGLSDPVIARHDRGAGNRRLPVSVMTICEIVADLAASIGVSFHPHLFRHLYAMEMLEKTKNLATVQDLLGHSDPKTTRIYAKLAADELRQAYRRAKNL